MTDMHTVSLAETLARPAGSFTGTGCPTTATDDDGTIIADHAARAVNASASAAAALGPPQRRTDLDARSRANVAALLLARSEAP